MSIQKVDLKPCSRCKKTLPSKSFGIKLSSKTGLTAECKQCRSDSRKQKRLNDAEYLQNERAVRRKGYHKNKDQINKRVKEKYFANHEAILRERREYWSKNSDKLNRRRRESYKDNPEPFVRSNLKWRSNNPEKVRAIAKSKKATRRTVERNAQGSLSPKEWLSVIEKYGNHCLKCKSTNKITMDHIVPLSKGGRNSIENVQPLCVSCNSRKRTKTIDYRPDTSCLIPQSDTIGYTGASRIHPSAYVLLCQSSDWSV